MSEHVERARGATIAVSVVRELVEYVDRKGIPRDTFLREAKFEPERLDAIHLRIPVTEVSHLVELAMDLTGDIALGLHWSASVGEASFGPLSPLIAHVATLRQAFETLHHFHGVLNDQASYLVEESGDEVMARCVAVIGESLRLQRFSTEMVVAGMFRLLRSCSPHAPVERICFEYAAPPYADEYVRLFGRAASFEQPFSGIVFNRSLMDAPAPHKDDDVHQALHAVAERRLLRINQRRTYAARVHEVLLQERWPQRADMGSVARALGISERSLRRRLAAEGTSYGEAVNEALAMVAKQALRDRRITIQETAYQMGFSDASTFHRAFKSWTGMTPGAYREAQTDDPKRD